MRTIALITLLALAICPVFSQPPGTLSPSSPGVSPFAITYCHSDAYHDHLALSDPDHRRRQADFDQEVYDVLSQGALPGGRSVLNIPTVVHLIHNNGPENLSNSVVLTAIDHINQAFRNQGYFDPNTGGDVEIELCLAQRDTNGLPTDGINRVQNGLTNMIVETQDLNLKNLSRWDPHQYLNIWVVQSITSLYAGAGVAGYSTLPGSHGLPQDGFVVEAQFFGSTPDNSKVGVHELGHYLGLYHTFQGGCTNNDCLQDGDRVCDTPPDGSTAPVPCGSSVNTCSTDDDDLSTNNPFRPVANGGLGDQSDLYQDYMDYGLQFCQNTFTQGQRDRMRAALQSTRSSLLQGMVCAPPCSPLATASFTSPATAIQIGQTLTFTNTSTGASTYSWEVNGQVVGTGLNLTYTFNTAGPNTVTLTVGNGSPGCESTFDLLIQVACTAQSSFIPPQGNIQPGQSVSFVNISQGGTAYTWLVDGLQVATTFNLSYAFPSPGIFQVQLVADNGACQDTFGTAVTVGQCENRSQNHWRFGNFGAVDFGSGSPVNVNGSAMAAFEGSAAVADDQGDLLFYTNAGIINTSSAFPAGVWNRNDQLMPNGNLGSNDAGCGSAVQATVIVPAPGNPNQYYIFTTDCNENNYVTGLSYHTVDMSLDNGNGDLVLKNQFVIANESEVLAAVRHCNGEDFWITTVSTLTNSIYVFLLTANGISSTPTHTIPFPNAMVASYMRFSPDGKMLGVMGPSNTSSSFGVHLFDFDPATGNLNFREHLPVNVITFGRFEFSSNSRYLYIYARTSSSQGSALRILQYDTQANPVAGSLFTSFGPSGSSLPVGIALAPNGKLYLANSQGNTMGVIDFPNQAQAAVQWSSIPLGTGVFVWSAFVEYPTLPYFQSDPVLSGAATACSGVPETYSVTYDSCGGANMVWDYRGAGMLSSSTAQSAVIQFGAAGTDTLIATRVGDCSVSADTFLIQVTAPGAPPHLGPDTVACGGSVVLSPGAGYVSYTWSDQSSQPSLTVSAPGVYWVETVDACGLIGRDSVVVEFPLPFVAPDLGPDLEVCNGAVVVLDPGSGYQSYFWQDATLDSSYTSFQAGVYWVEVSDGCGAVGRDTVEIVFLPVTPPDLRPDTSLCREEIYILDPGPGYVSYLWQSGNTDPTFTTTISGIYWVEVVDSCGQVYRDTVVRTPCVGGAEAAQEAFDFAVVPNPNQGSFTVQANLPPGVNELEVEFWDALGRLVTRRRLLKPGRVLGEEFHLDVADGVYLLRLKWEGREFSRPVWVRD